MQLSPSTKLGLIAFLVIDLALAVVFVSLYLLRSDRDLQAELREIGTTIYNEPFELSTFTLTDHHGNEFSKDDLLGNWNLVFFGFTSCPNICPLTMRELGRLATNWEASVDGRLPQIILATVDPGTDTPEKLNQYLLDFSPEFVGLTGDADALSHFAEELFVAYGDPETTAVQASGHGDHGATTNPGDFVIDHSSHLSVIDPNGDLFAVMRPPHRTRDIAQALKLITD